jgi:hypothetical protein
MRVALLAGLFIVASQGLHTTEAGQGKVIDIVRSSSGNLEFSTDREFSPADVTELVREAEVIVRGVVESANSRLSTDERRIESDYKLRIVDTYLASPGLQAGDAIVVSRPGGVLTIEGRVIVDRESDFPPFQPGEEYVLFLQLTSQRGVYIVPHGAQGAFIQANGYVEQVATTNGKVKSARGRIATDAFASEIRELSRNR